MNEKYVVLWRKGWTFNMSDRNAMLSVQRLAVNCSTAVSCCWEEINQPIQSLRVVGDCLIIVVKECVVEIVPPYHTHSSARHRSI